MQYCLRSEFKPTKYLGGYLCEKVWNVYEKASTSIFQSLPNSTRVLVWLEEKKNSYSQSKQQSILTTSRACRTKVGMWFVKHMPARGEELLHTENVMEILIKLQ